MDGLTFEGQIINGRGTYVELGVPGRDDVEGLPQDWPEKLCPGSLNFEIIRYPAAFVEKGIAKSAKSLDIMGFAPAFELARDAFENNQLGPRPGMPHGGSAQVWRAKLYVRSQVEDCWVLRRFGSGLGRELEIVSAFNLREKLGLDRGSDWPARLELQGVWRA